ncbi:MAG TPA: hypothetical protein VFQ15_09720 [Jiangellaceae bacterium]|nr:hypothetical protein [Jiangellaceae bacterium]
MTTPPRDDDADTSALHAALDTLTDALEAHLDACLVRSGDADPNVQAAYTALRQAAERYDDLLFDLREEVTPWEFPEGPHTDVEYEDEDALPSVVGVLVRRDYDLAETDALLGAGREAYAELYPSEPVESAVADVTHAGRALYQMLHAYGVDGLDQRAESAGLVPRGGTVWVQALDEADAETLVDDPFGVADEDMLVYRLDEVIDVDAGLEP